MALIKTAFASLLCTGCFWFTTKSEGEGLRKDVTTLQSKIDTKEKDLSTDIAKLQETLTSADHLMKTNSANIGADVGSLKDDMRNVRGLITASKQYADEIAEKVSSYLRKIAPPEPHERWPGRLGPVPGMPPSWRSRSRNGSR